MESTPGPANFSRLLLFFLLCNCAGENNTSTSSQKSSQAGLAATNPLFGSQWHLKNTGQTQGTSGEDLNLGNTWENGNQGKNISILIVDDGIDSNHPDLSDNLDTSHHLNVLDQSRGLTNTTPGNHGTAVAGIIAASNNNIGIIGVAPAAKISVVNLLAASTISNTITALTHDSASTAISNNSWGPADGTGQFISFGSTIEAALISGITSGRNGLGTLYVFSAGNGATNGDNANYDGLANFYAVIAICSVDHQGTAAAYSEPGANLWVCTPSANNNFDPGIVTTDVSGGGAGFNLSSSSDDLSDRSYSKLFGGTSASAPMASGVLALILHENPTLTWRDARIILAKSARKNDPSSNGWSTNGAGYPIHHSYGMGVIDVAAAVALAKTWSLVGTWTERAFPTTGSQSVAANIPNNSTTGISSTLVVSGSRVSKIEYVEVNVNLTHNDWGELEITLNRVGTPGTQSVLAQRHTCLTSSLTATNCSVSSGSWRFGSSRHLGEAADGSWMLTVKDRAATNSGGILNSWSLKFYGEE